MDYAPDLWHDFAVTVGGLAGALTGLLFVALSIKSEVLDRSLRSRAAQTLVLFVTSALIPAVLASLTGGVINAWLFLIEVPGKAAGPGPPVP